MSQNQNTKMINKFRLYVRKIFLTIKAGMFWNSLLIGALTPFQIQPDKLTELDEFMICLSRD